MYIKTRNKEKTFVRKPKRTEEIEKTMEEKRMEMNEAVVMNEEELTEVNGGIDPVTGIAVILFLGGLARGLKCK